MAITIATAALNGVRWTVIWVDYGFWRTLRQAVWRAASRAWRHQELWPGTGNCESFRRSFCSRESIIPWTRETRRQHRRRYLAVMQDPQYRHIRFVRVRNPRQAEGGPFLHELKRSVQPGISNFQQYTCELIVSQ